VKNGILIRCALRETDRRSISGHHQSRRAVGGSEGAGPVEKLRRSFARRHRLATSRQRIGEARVERFG